MLAGLLCGRRGRSGAGGKGRGPGSGLEWVGVVPSVRRPRCSAPLAVHTQGNGPCISMSWAFQEKPEIHILVGNLLVHKSELKSRPINISESRIWLSGGQLVSCLTQTWEDQRGFSGKMSQGHKCTTVPKKYHQKQIWKEWQSQWQLRKPKTIKYNFIPLKLENNKTQPVHLGCGVAGVIINL